MLHQINQRKKFQVILTASLTGGALTTQCQRKTLSYEARVPKAKHCFTPFLAFVTYFVRHKTLDFGNKLISAFVESPHPFFVAL